MAPLNGFFQARCCATRSRYIYTGPGYLYGCTTSSIRLHFSTEILDGDLGKVRPSRDILQYHLSDSHHAPTFRKLNMNTSLIRTFIKHRSDMAQAAICTTFKYRILNRIDVLILQYVWLSSRRRRATSESNHAITFSSPARASPSLTLCLRPLNSNCIHWCWLTISAKHCG